jgi:hypothetical protein
MITLPRMTALESKGPISQTAPGHFTVAVWRFGRWQLRYTPTPGGETESLICLRGDCLSLEQRRQAPDLRPDLLDGPEHRCVLCLHPEDRVERLQPQREVVDGPSLPLDVQAQCLLPFEGVSLRLLVK